MVAKKSLAVIMLLSFLLIAGCVSPTGETNANLGEQFSIAIGQSAAITGEELEIKFLEVITDSRCPAGATCVWQGEVTCLVEITYFESPYRKVLTQPGLTEEPARSEFKEYEITFNIEPYPEVGRDIKEGDYRLRLRVGKKPILSGGILVTFNSSHHSTSSGT